LRVVSLNAKKCSKKE